MANERGSIAHGVIWLYGMCLESQLESCILRHHSHKVDVFMVNRFRDLFGIIINFLELGGI